jgi:glutathione reductase (NADPH)
MADLDLFVIGAGSGGVACARRAAGYGARVAIAERSRVGGTCVIRGCVPKKLMHYAAQLGEAVRAARAYGWETTAPRLVFRRLLEARNREIARLNGLYIGMLERAGVRLLTGEARILGRDGEGFCVAVGAERLTATRVLVATGARPRLPALPGLEHALTSDAVLEELYDQPRRVAVVGGGYIGVELASILHALGSETTLVIRRDLPLAGFDRELRERLTEQLVAHGLRLAGGRAVAGIERRDAGLVLHTDGAPVEADAVLLATGRDPLPNTTGIGLEALGVAMHADGAIRVDRDYESTVPGLLAVGDCADHAGQGLHAGQHDLTPIAIAEGRHVAERLFNDRRVAVAYDTVPTAVFGLPQVGSVGLSEELARGRGREVRIFRTEFRPMLHTLTGGPARTFMKLVVDTADDRVLGLHMVGDDAAEIVQGFAVAMTAGATKAHFDATVALHPTAAEEFVTMYQPAG